MINNQFTFTNTNTNPNLNILDGKGKVIVGRVKNIFLDQTNDENLGAIEIQPIYPENQTTIVAYPFFPNTTSYPLLEEIVLCNKLPSELLGTSESSEKYYYMGVVNVWNNPHVNFYPSPRTTSGNIPTSERKSYQDVSAGSTIKIDSNLPEKYPSIQGTFEERDNVHPLQPYLGDTIYQGRFGNSIRLGSTNNVVTTTTQSPRNITTPPPPSETTTLSETKSQTFSSGDSTLSATFKNSLLKLNNFIFSKTQKDTNFEVKSVTILGGESQVTNPSSTSVGGLAQSRVNKVKSLIESNYTYLNENIRTQITVGSTPYTSGVDDPQDPKYTSEQFVRIKVVYVLPKTNSQQVANNPTPSPQATQKIQSLNSWSKTGDSGDPIIILRNGQPENNLPDKPWSPIDESINEDPSSIYLTSTQRLPINTSNSSYLSYQQPPTLPSQYSGAQVIINSDRLVFNAKKDHALISGEKSVNLSSNGSLNFDTKNFIVEADEIKLGSLATEPLVKGETLRQELDFLLKSLIQMVEVLKYTQSWPGGGAVVDASTSTTADGVEKALTDIKNNLDSILSTKSKTV